MIFFLLIKSLKHLLTFITYKSMYACRSIEDWERSNLVHYELNAFEIGFNHNIFFKYYMSLFKLIELC